MAVPVQIKTIFSTMGQESKYPDAKTQLYDALCDLNKRQEEFSQRFMNRQRSDYLSTLKQCDKSSFNRTSEYNEDSSYQNNSEVNLNRSNFTSDSSLQNSSLTGHFMRCLKDSPISSIKNSQTSISTNYPPDDSDTSPLQKNQIGDSSSSRFKRPFLKKKTGLLRYMPGRHRKSEPDDSSFNPSVPSISDPTLPPKPVPQVKSRLRPHVQFRDPVASDVQNRAMDPPSTDSLSTEKKDLEIFEMLENCAQNSSFNSDSSFVHRALNGDVIQNAHPVRSLPSVEQNDTGLKTINLLDKLALYQKDIQSKQASLQQEISRTAVKADRLLANTRSSTPVNGEESFPHPGNEFDSRHSVETVEYFSPNEPGGMENEDQLLSVGDHLKEKTPIQTSDTNIKEDKPHVFEKTITEEETTPTSSLLREKMSQLEKEIRLYQEKNSHLSNMAKERDELLKKLKKDQEEFGKHKEEMEKKFENERRQMKREKDTMNRLQKLKSDNPTRKEREELTTLRQEVEKLKDEMKKQKVRYNNDTRRMKNQLVNAEKERDLLKLENIKLEEQCKDLLETLKSQRLKKKKASVATNTLDKEECISNQPVSVSPEVTENVSLEDGVSSQNVSHHRVRFNLDHQIETDPLPQDNGNYRNGLLDYYGTTDANINNHLKPNLEFNGTLGDQNSRSTSEYTRILHPNPEYQEILHDDKIERIYPNGDTELIFPSGTRKYFCADGEVIKVTFYNGDVKEIFPDTTIVYRYANGVVEKRLCGGSVVTEFTDGQIEKSHPDGLKEIRFPDDTQHFIYPDGSEEMHSPDGTTVRVGVDGTETIEFPNGEREIHTETYKRREFPDGSVKIIYQCGKQETRYSNGRIRIKDKDGLVLVDTKNLIS